MNDVSSPENSGSTRPEQPGATSPQGPGPAEGAGASLPDSRSELRGRRGRSRPRGRVANLVYEVALIGVTALVISFVVKTFVAQAFWIPSGSMEETLVYGDRVLVSKIQAGPMKVDRGDIVVFEDPGGWLPPTTPVDRGPVMNAVLGSLRFVGIVPAAEGNHLIKRVIGMGGDHVVCCDDDGRITVNGQALNESDYLFPGNDPSTVEFDITVPEGHLWMMGDHRANSRDSRDNDQGDGNHGSIPQENVVGQAFMLIFPLSNATWFSIPDTFEQVPEADMP